MVDTAAVTEARPDILKYKEYRTFLEDIYRHKKSLRAGFSFRRFAQMAGITSPNYLQLVMQGKRNLSDELAAAVAKALGLTAAECRYFIALVCHDNAKTFDARRQAQDEILRSIKELVSKEIPKAKLHVLTEWYHLVVRELVLLSDFEASGEWISRKMRGSISAKEADESLLFLQKSGFIQNVDGRWVQSDPVLDTGNAFDEVVGLKFHANTLSAWSQALASTEKHLRELGVINIPMDLAKIPELKERIRKFQDEIVGWLQDEKSPNRIVQLGIYLIPTTE